MLTDGQLEQQIQEAIGFWREMVRRWGGGASMCVSTEAVEHELVLLEEIDRTVCRLRAALTEIISAPAVPSLWEHGPHERTAAEIAEEALRE